MTDESRLSTETAAAIREIATLAEQGRRLEVFELGNTAGVPGVPDKINIGVRFGERSEIIDLSGAFEGYRAHPKRKSGTAVTLSLGSFIDLTNRHKTADTAIFGKTDWRKPSLEAVIDYHHLNEAGDDGDEGLVIKVGTPDWLRHRIRYDYPLSDDWKVWVEKNGQSFSQTDFAAFIEDRIADLTSPEDAERIWLERDFETKVATPSELIRLSRGLQINVESKVKSIVSLASGAAQIQFEEVHQDADGQPLTVPGLFLLKIAPFASGARIRLPIRLRYRKQGGAIVWFYQMYRPDQFITERLRDDITEVTTKTGLPVYEGTPES